MSTYQFKGTRIYTEYLTIEVECETLEEAQKIIDSGSYDEDCVISSSGIEEVDLEYIGIENYMDLDDPRLIDLLWKE